MHIKFWGVRGSIPTPEYRNHRYGGNTTCIEVRLENGTIFILDCGSGLRGLGNSLQREFGKKPIHGFVLMSHFHWDHIQGIPFFRPLYDGGNAFLFISVKRKKNDIRSVIEGQMSSPYFPTDMTAVASSASFCDLDFNEIDIQGALIRPAPLNHPQGCVAYRIKADGSSFVFATDTEPGVEVYDRALRELAQGADVMVYDAQYTPEQLSGVKKGWGHSSWFEGVRIAEECGIRRLILTHHDPDSDDEYVDGLVAAARKLFPSVEAASEGLEIHLPQGDVSHAYENTVPRHERRFRVELPARVMWGKNGHQGSADGLVLNVSKSGIYFLVPKDIPVEKTFEVEMTVPAEITGEDEKVARFRAQPLRTRPVNRALFGNRPCQGVVARRLEGLNQSLGIDSPIASETAKK
ncbi:MAG: MBL fold metallo-hydrolase [Terriglobia bacterium]